LPNLTSPPRWLDLLARAARGAPDLRGRGRLAIWLYERVGGDAKWEWTVPLRDTLLLTLPGGALQSWLAAFSGDYDPESREFLFSLVSPGSYVIDVGASFGLYALPLARMGREHDVSLVAIEPVPGNVAALRRNLELNGLTDRFRVLELALGSEPGELEMVIESGRGGNAAVALPGSPLMVPFGRCRVPVRCLDDLDLPSSTERRCGLLKIDVEGFEPLVLRGGRRFIEQHQPAIAAEFHPEWLEARGFGREAAVAWADEIGYRAFGMDLRRVDAWSDRRRVELVLPGDSSWETASQILLVPQTHDLARIDGGPSTEPAAAALGAHRPPAL
jgi:FkbM family methyltransferase